MKNRFGSLAVVLPAAFLALGCADGHPTSPALPSDQHDTGLSSQAEVRQNSSRSLWGLWVVDISSDRAAVEIVPVRGPQMHVNVVRLLEVTPCADCLEIGNIKIVEPNVLEADVTLTHPYPGLLKYTGFDVRGIFISQANYTFPVSGRKIAWGTDVPILLNADGYTNLFNPTEFPENQPGPPALRYIPGKLATGGDLSTTLNPFLAYRRDAPRRMFEAGGSEMRTFRLYAPQGPIHFGYAVDASWQLVENVIDPLTDFPPDANCLEAYEINIDLPYGVNSCWMSENLVSVDVSDHQGVGTISSVTAEAPDLFSGEVALTLSTQTGEESWLFTGFITNETAAGHGEYPLLVKVTDSESDQNLGAIQAWGVAVADFREGWARTWGGISWDQGYGVATDVLGSVYVTGQFRNMVDFDPGSGADNHTSNGFHDVFLSKFDSSGTFAWARTWGGYSSDSGCGVAVDGSGNVYVTGFFYGTVDFDPGSGVDNHTGYTDVFLSKFDPSGDFKWARTWGGSGNQEGRAVAVDGLGDVYVTGGFMDLVDFDPGSGLDKHVSNGGFDVFLSKLDSIGAFQWARTWGGTGADEGNAVGVDGSGNVCVTGVFGQTVDFDPGSGADNHTSNGGRDPFLSQFDSSGTFLWARTWGGSDSDEGCGVAVDVSGNVYVTGPFRGTVDLDPGSGVDNHTSNGDRDVFLSRFDSNGTFNWARTWGGSGIECGHGVAVYSAGNVYVTGEFTSYTVDFDPGSGVDNHTANGNYDVFLSKFDTIGDFQWARTWGGAENDLGDTGYDIAVDGSEKVYVTGWFYCGPVDFDPGDGVDDHTSNGLEDAFLVKFLPDGSW